MCYKKVTGQFCPVASEHAYKYPTKIRNPNPANILHGSPKCLQSNTEDRPWDRPTPIIETYLALRTSMFDPSKQVTYFSVYERIYPET